MHPSKKVSPELWTCRFTHKRLSNLSTVFNGLGSLLFGFQNGEQMKCTMLRIPGAKKQHPIKKEERLESIGLHGCQILKVNLELKEQISKDISVKSHMPKHSRQ